MTLCLSPKPSVMDLNLLVIPIGIHIADRFNTVSKADVY